LRRPASLPRFVRPLACGATLAIAAIGCKDARTATRPPPPADIATGATNARLVDPKNELEVRSSAKAITPIENPFGAPPAGSTSADPLAPKVRPSTQL
jgi:hypothetical protein